MYLIYFQCGFECHSILCAISIILHASFVKFCVFVNNRDLYSLSSVLTTVSVLESSGFQRLTVLSQPVCGP